MSGLPSLHRTLDQELLALSRGVSLECLVCGEFVMHKGPGRIACPECGSELRDEQAAGSAVQLTMQAG